MKRYSPRSTVEMKSKFATADGVARLPSDYQMEVIDPSGTKTIVPKAELTADETTGEVVGTFYCVSEGDWRYGFVGLGDMPCANDQGRFVIIPGPFV